MAEELNAKQQIYLRVLLDHYHEGNQEALLRSLPPAQAKEIAVLKIVDGDPSAIFLNPSKALESVHYSWISEEIAKKPKPLHPFFIASLSTTIQRDLKKLLGESAAKPLAPILSTYFCHQLFLGLGMDELLPKSFLPETPLFPLINLSKSKLVDIIDYFGLYDLSEEIRTIVNTKNLKNIYACLTPKKHQFLRNCMHLKDRLVAPKLNLDKWDGNCQELQKILHRRGLNRFGKALSGQHPHLIWYLTHTLDVGRGKILASQVSPEEVPGITPVLNVQLLNLLDFLEGSN